jgi:hypothetical protein
MGSESGYFPGVVVIGVAATMLVDLWSLFLKRILSIPSLSYCLVGRWFLHMPKGTFMHANIAAAGKKRLECTVGWIVHYATGLVFAIGFVSLVSDDWIARPAPLSALLFGIGTVLFPFLVMQPSFGLGLAAAKSPDPTTVRFKSLMTHFVFGAGLYLSAVAWNLVPGGST